MIPAPAPESLPEEQCARCGRVGIMFGHAIVGDQAGAYCHDRPGSCYEQSGRASWPELRHDAPSVATCDECGDLTPGHLCEACTEYAAGEYVAAPPALIRRPAQAARTLTAHALALARWQEDVIAAATTWVAQWDDDPDFPFHLPVDRDLINAVHARPTEAP